MDTDFSRAEAEDEAFQMFVGIIENEYHKLGAYLTRTRIEEYREEEIDSVVYEIEENYGVTLTSSELDRSFSDAFKMIDNLYGITNQVKAMYEIE